MKKNKIMAIILSTAMIMTMAGSMLANSKTNKNTASQIKYTTLLSDATNPGNWVQSNGSWYYKDSHGTPETEWQTINNTKYYFNAEGIMQTGWQNINGNWYDFNSNGAMITGWQGSNGNWYYLNSNGVMQTGWQNVNGTWYDLNSSGAMQTGWQGSNGNWYYLNSNGAMQTGWQNINGTRYYFNSNGAMQTGWQNVNGTRYYFNSDGTMQTGWQNINGTSYYLNSNGAMQTGWQNINENWYDFNSNGIMQTGWQGSNGNWYYLNSKGIMQTGWQDINNTWYYLNSTGAMQTGWQGSNGNWYYLNSNGAMQTGWLNLSGSRYYLNSNGAMQTGTTTINGISYTFNSNGALEKKPTPSVHNIKLSTVNSPVGLWLLQSPSMQGAKIQCMPFNTTVTVLKTQGSWTQVNCNGVLGWCYNEYLTATPNTTSNPNTSQATHENNIKTLSIKGLDVSNYQGNVDFTPIKKAGYNTAIIEAGDDVFDPASCTLDSQYEAAKSAGMNIGFYYFFNPNSNIQQQAQNFWNDIKNKNYDVYPVIDIETSNSNQDVTGQVLEFMNAFKSLSGLNCIIYTNYNFANTHLDNRLTPYKCWIADYNESVPSNNIWNKKDYVGWQYTGSGQISGLSNSLDLDKFTSGIYINSNNPYVVNENTGATSFAVENNNISLAKALGVTSNSTNNSKTPSIPSMLVIGNN